MRTDRNTATGLIILLFVLFASDTGMVNSFDLSQPLIIASVVLYKYTTEDNYVTIQMSYCNRGQKGDKDSVHKW